MNANLNTGITGEIIMISIIQTVFLIAVSPLISGIIKKVKAVCQFRQGPPVLQPYYDLIKYTKKESVVSDTASWLFFATPYIMLAAFSLAAFLIPTLSYKYSVSPLADIILIIYLMALARFFLTLAAMDTASAFGGMASSREMMVCSIAEPSIILSFISIALTQRSTNLSNIMSSVAGAPNIMFTAENLFVLFALFLIVIAETGRVPFDNPATHLELTMIHEGMILEYCGKYLAMINLAAYIKQAALFTLIVNIFFPYAMMSVLTLNAFLISAAAYLFKIIIFSIIVGVFESSISKSRLFQLPDLIGIAFVLALTSIITNIVKS